MPFKELTALAFPRQVFGGVRTVSYKYNGLDLQVPEGCYQVKDDPKTLLLDLDTADSLRQCLRGLTMVDRLWGIRDLDVWESRSGNLHMVVYLLIAMPFADRLAVQTALGSDPARTLINLAEAHETSNKVNRLFRPGR